VHTTSQQGCKRKRGYIELFGRLVHQTTVQQHLPALCSARCKYVNARTATLAGLLQVGLVECCRSCDVYFTQLTALLLLPAAAPLLLLPAAACAAG
jgi:hypothetical protein